MDKLLLDGIQRGDVKAFRRFYDKYFERLFTFSLFYLKCSDLAEEAVSDVFVAMWLKRESLHNINNIEAYLYKAVKNKSLTILRKKSTAPVFMNLDSLLVFEQAIDDFHPESSLFLKEFYERMDRAVERLPVQCKIVFKLIREEGMKYREVAEILEISHKAVEKQMARAHRKLRPLFEDYLNNPVRERNQNGAIASSLN